MSENKNEQENNEKGFTLMEVLITITIIAILSAIAIIGYTKVYSGMRDTLAKTRLGVFAEAESRFKLGMGRGRYAGACELTNTTSGSGEKLIPETIAKFDASCAPVPIGDWAVSGVDEGSAVLRNKFLIRLTKQNPAAGEFGEYCISEDGVLRRATAVGSCDRTSEAVQ